MVAKLEAWFLNHWKAMLALAGGVVTEAISRGLFTGTAQLWAQWVSVIGAIPAIVALGPANKPIAVPLLAAAEEPVVELPSPPPEQGEPA